MQRAAVHRGLEASESSKAIGFSLVMSSKATRVLRILLVSCGAGVIAVTFATSGVSASTPLVLGTVSCHASMSNARPADYSTTDVRVTTFPAPRSRLLPTTRRRTPRTRRRPMHLAWQLFRTRSPERRLATESSPSSQLGPVQGQRHAQRASRPPSNSVQVRGRRAP